MAAPPKTRKKPIGPPPKKSSNTALIVVIALAVVAVIGLVVAVVSQVGKGGSSPAGLNQTQPVQVKGAALAPLPDSGADPARGQTPPTLVGKSFDGTPITIEPDDGKPKLVMFFAHWCPHCQAELPRVVQWQHQGLIPTNIDVYGVATGTDSAAPNYPPSAWLQRIGWTNPTLADSSTDDAAKAWGLPSYPYFVAVDGNGKVVTRATGELTQQQFTDLLAQLNK